MKKKDLIKETLGKSFDDFYKECEEKCSGNFSTSSSSGKFSKSASSGNFSTEKTK